MEDIIKLLPVMLKMSQYNEEVCERASFAAWRTVVGEAIARTSRPQRLTRKMLVVAVIDEPWQKQLEMMTSQIIFKINSLFGSPIITGLEFYIDAETVRAALPPPPLQLKEDFNIDPKIIAAAEQIKDPDLRARFLATASKYIQAQQFHDEE